MFYVFISYCFVFLSSQSGDGDGAFHIPAGKSQGKTAVPGFTLKF